LVPPDNQSPVDRHSQKDTTTTCFRFGSTCTKIKFDNYIYNLSKKLVIYRGDSFTLKKQSIYGDDVLHRRIASYIIERWKDSKINGIQELLTLYKSIL